MTDRLARLLRRVVPLCFAAVLLVAAGYTYEHVHPGVAYADLPTTCRDGATVVVTDNIRGEWRCKSNKWHSITGYADIRDFGAVLNNSTDDTSAIQAALNAAYAALNSTQRPAVFLGTGKAKVTSTLTVKVPILGNGPLASQLVSYITDNSAVLAVNYGTAGADGISLKDFGIISSGSSSTKHFTGITTPSNVNHGHISNVVISDAYLGADLAGYSWNIFNLRVWRGTYGVKFTNFTSSFANLSVDGADTLGVEIVFAANSQLVALVEGSGVDGIKVTEGRGLDIIAYLESFTGNGFDVGGTADKWVRNLSIKTDNGAGVSGTFDRVDGLRFHGAGVGSPTFTANAIHVDTSGLTVPLTTGVEFGQTSNLYLPYVRSQMVNGGPMQAQNFIINPYFHDAFRGYYDHNTGGWSKQTRVNNATVAIDATNVFNGGGLAVTCDGVNGGNYVLLYLSPAIVNAVKGKRVQFGGWYYLPHDDTWFPNPFVAGAAAPGIYLYAWDGASDYWYGIGSAPYLNERWNFVAAESTLPAGITHLALVLVTNFTGAVHPPITVYATFSGVFLVEASHPVGDLMRGNWVTHPLAGQEIGGKLIIPDTQAPTSTAMSYLVGDRWLNTAPAEAGSSSSKYTVRGGVNTVAGSPGTFLDERTLTGN